MPKNFTRSTLFWLPLIFTSLAGIFFSYHYFPVAFPLVNLELEMNRHSALEAGRTQAQLLHIGPSDYNQTANFEVDNDTKNFIELEGGEGALTTVLADNIYSPYHWIVRHFEEYNPHELQLYFQPDGTPYGFTEKIPEDLQGPALSRQEAQNIAQELAKKHWNINFSLYTLVEFCHVKQPNERVDHTFVYERKSKKVGKAPYRLTLVVQGNRLTKVKPSLQIPEGFKRRYEHMRSANKTVSVVALFLMALLYIFGGCLGGIIYLYHRTMLRLKMPLIWGFVIATLQALNNVNNTPLMWLNYDTATSTANFLVQILLNIVLQWILLFCLLSLIFAVAESLTRCAFGDHPKLWRVWKPEYASSFQILGRTIGGYFVAGIHIAFVVIMYGFSTRYLGWWAPSEALINPNILATYFPWFSSIAQSAMAGFMEECLFRAIPLAGAMLLGRYFKRPTLFVSIAFILQAIVFGAAHAEYPAQPAYARLVELLVPSSIFGGMYLAFGLLPAIISHYVYDVVWFALALFVTTAPGSLLNQIMVIVGAAVPLAIVLVARLRRGAWTELPDAAYNRSSREQENNDVEALSVPHIFDKHERYSTAFVVAGIAGLLFWSIFTRFDHDGLILPSNRNNVLNSTKALFETEKPANKQWTQLGTVKQEKDPQHVFIWRTHGKEVYKKLLGTYLAPAYWLVRFASFTGDVAERAEEYRWHLGQDKNLLRKEHILPEDKTGITLTKEEATVISEHALQNYFNFDKDHVQKISAVSSKKPHRVDWTFTYQTPAATKLEKGKTRTTVTIADGQITDIYRDIFVPEKWLRKYTHEKTIDTIISLASYLLLILLFIILASFGITHFGFFNLHYPTFIVFALCLVIKSTIQFFNLFLLFESNFVTSEPYSTQIGTLLAFIVIQIIFFSAFYGYLASILFSMRMHITSSKPFVNHVVMGLSAGALFAGISAILKYVGPELQPLWPDYSYLGAHIPWLNMALINATSFITLAIPTLLVFLGIDYLTRGWHHRKVLGTIICIFLGIGLLGITTIETISWWLLSGSLSGLVILLFYYLSFRYERIRIIWALYMLCACKIIQQIIFNAWPGVIGGGILSIALITLISFVWSKSLYKRTAH